MREDAYTIEEAITRHLRTVENVRALVGVRVFEDSLPENSNLPAVTVESNGFQDWGALDAPPTNGVSQIAIDCMAQEAGEAARVRDAVLTAVHELQGVELYGVEVQSAAVANWLSDSPKPDWLKGNAFCKRAIFNVVHSL